MIHEQLLRLKGHKNYPSVSIILPTSRTFPDFKKDEIVLKNLLKEAETRLLDKFHKREVTDVIEKLEQIISQIDYKHLQDSMGIFVSREIQEVVYMPFKAEKLVVIDDSFQVRDIIHSINRMYHYGVMVVSDKATKFYEGYDSSLQEKETEGLPIGIDDVHYAEGNVGDPRAKDTSRLEEKNRIKLVTAIDEIISKEISSDLPLVIIGVDKQLGFFNKITKNAGQIILNITGSYDYASVHELSKLIYPKLLEHIKAEKSKLFDQLSAAVGSGNYTSGINQVWRKANEGRVRTMVVEEGYLVKADLSEDKLGLIIHENSERKPHIQDAVDDLAEIVLLKGGNVRFVEPGSLKEHNKVASINRY